MTAPLRVGYAHVGPREHGVSRYGRLLAATASHRSDLIVAEAEVDVTGNRSLTRASIRHAATVLQDADVIHVQYNHHWDKCLWGRRWAQLGNLRQLAAWLPVPIIATVHDMYEQPAPWNGLDGFIRVRLAMAGRRTRQNVTRPFRSTTSQAGDRGRRADWREAERNGYPDAFTLWWLSRRARDLVVCSAEEARRLNGFLGSGSVRTIAHFVEARPPLPPHEDAKRVLGLNGRRIVTELGFIHPRKGYGLLIESMQHLPPDITVVLAGGPATDYEAYAAQLSAQAVQGQARPDLRVTGPLSEAELNLWLAATDVAVCPFSSVSASGSLSTWISAARPVLASPLPLMLEYQRLAPGAVRTFSPYTAPSLALAILDGLASLGTSENRAAAQLRDALAIDAIVEQHVGLYRAASRRARRRQA